MTDPSNVASTSPPGWHAESGHAAAAHSATHSRDVQPTISVSEFTPDNPQPPRGRAGPAAHTGMDAAKTRVDVPASPAKGAAAGAREENVRCTLSSLLVFNHQPNFDDRVQVATSTLHE